MRPLGFLMAAAMTGSLACEVSSADCPVGSVDCLCTVGGGCDPGLECNATNVCIDPDAPPETSDSGASASGGHDDGNDRGDTHDGGGSGGEEPECDAAALQPSIIELCEVQASAKHTPQPGQTGSECSNGDQCSGSGICLDDYPYDGFGYCADACTTDDDCPFGFVCGPTNVDKRCTNADCWVSTSADACVSEYLGRAVDACQAGCEDEFATWFTCLAGAAPVCFEGDASECSTAKGLLDHCCEDGNLCS